MTLEAEIHGFIASAGAAWPGIPVEPSTLSERILAAVEDAEDRAAAIASLHPDLLLVDAALAGDPLAYEALDELIVRSAERAATRDAPADMLAQHVRQLLLVGDGHRPAKLNQYSGKGPLGAWLRVLITRAGLSMQRGENRRAAHLAGDEALADAVSLQSSPEVQLLRSAYAEPFRAAFREALSELGAEERNMLRMHLVDGLGIDELAPLHAVHRATAARRLNRIRASVLERTRALLIARVGIAENEFDSLLALMLSRVEVSVSFS